MSDANSKEPRHFSRVPFRAEVRLAFHLAHEEQGAHLLDISLKGALAELTHPPANVLKGELCRMTLFLGGGEHITMEGVVAHHEGRLVGIECKQIDVDSMSNLRRLIELNTGDAARLERELGEMLKAGQPPRSRDAGNAA